VLVAAIVAVPAAMEKKKALQQKAMLVVNN
jgi:hypothetical protein